MSSANPKIVVLGAGFGGLTFCETFKHPAAQITLVDRQNHHLFQPLLYQVASAGLSGPDIAQPVRSILADKPNVTVLMDEVIDFDLKQRLVFLEKNTLRYDYLVLALGAVTGYFGHPEWEEFAPGLKTLDDAMRIRRQILLAFERAEDELDPKRVEQLMTIVVVGGGPTGLELAGAFAELARFVLRRDFRHIDSARAKVILIEGSSRLVEHFPERLSEKAREQVERLGVKVMTNTRVKNITKGKVELSDGREIYAENIIWAAGVSASPLTKKLNVHLDRGGRIIVNPDLSVPGFNEVFAVGDIAHVVDRNGKQVPGVSPAAMQMARYVSRIIETELQTGKRPSEPFRYRNKGNMATIGRSAGIAEVAKLQISGFLAWLLWLVVHLVFLIGFRNKVSVLFQWAYSYFTYKRGARLITGVEQGTVHEEPAHVGA